MKSQTSSVLSLYLVSILSGTANAQAYGLQQQQQLLAPSSGNAQQAELPDAAAVPARNGNAPPALSMNNSLISDTLRNMVSALDVMQDCYYELWLANWPSCNHWTAAVMATQVSATLSSLTASPDDILALMLAVSHDEDGDGHQEAEEKALAFENLINRFFAHTSVFYFGENAFELRNEAYDDMLWVVLEWLESIKFQRLHSDLRYNTSRSEGDTTGRVWHGSQFQVPAAHRARLFYDLASAGWDNTLCNGGMVWNPKLTPYKNAITNELYIAASIGMYLYFPGDVISSPFVAGSTGGSASGGNTHNPVHLQAAIKGYRWLNSSGMTIQNGLYGDGFHIAGWQNAQHPGTRQCDVLNTMTYTYNQGVILSGLRGLWLATGSGEYLRDGHNLVQKVIQATGWDNPSRNAWAGLGRGGVLEDTCDAPGDCSQDGQTFKGIFFHHFTEFCRPLWPQEEQFLAHAADLDAHDWTDKYRQHRTRCRQYRPWIEHNAQAALKTLNEHGQFGMWWGQPYGAQSAAVNDDSTTTPTADDNGNSSTNPLPRGAIDYRNHGRQGEGSAGLPLGATAFDSADDARTRAFGRDHSAREDRQSTRAPPPPPDQNNRGRGRTVETQAGGVAVLRALYESYIYSD